MSGGVGVTTVSFSALYTRSLQATAEESKGLDRSLSIAVLVLKVRRSFLELPLM